MKTRLPYRSRSLMAGIYLAVLLSGASTLFAATFTVSNGNDSGPGSLRQAVADAEVTPGDDTIVFETGFTGPVTLTSGELLVSTTISINGPEGGQISIERSSAGGTVPFRIFNVATAGVLTLRYVAVRNGLQLVVNNGDNVFAGGIYNGGHLTLDRVAVENNKIDKPESQRQSFVSGGGIYNAGTLSIANSILANNEARGDNSALGGAIFNAGPATVAITDSRLANNRVEANTAGGITSGPGRGGAIYNDGSVTITRSALAGNSVIGRSGYGGAAANHGTMSVTQTALYNNICRAHNINGASHGGGIYSEAGLTVSNSTIANNTVSDGLFNWGGGIYGSGELNYVTVAHNSAGSGSTSAFQAGGIYSTNVSLRNSIVAGNSGYQDAPQVQGSFTSEGYNLIENTTGSAGWTGTDKQNMPARITALGNYGGTTQTVALLPGSPAIDAAEPMTFPPIDQRGRPRPIDGDGDGTALPDIGAFERDRRLDYPVQRAGFDFDGDFRSDISVFRPASGTWYLDRSAAGFAAVNWGLANDNVVPADFDADGKDDIAVFRPSNGNWYILNSSSGTVSFVHFGQAGDIPLPADIDGDAKADLRVFRSDGVWYQRSSISGQVSATGFGSPGDQPLNADFDADGRADIAVFRLSNGTWYWVNSLSGSLAGLQWGLATDIAVPADYDGDQRSDIAVYRTNTRTWYVLTSLSGQAVIKAFGAPGDIPVPADYDGDGRADISVFRPADGAWWIDRSTTGIYSVQFGTNGDRPLPAAYTSQ